ncbi:MAG: nucleotidyl transferase AbiEii/AbiGii toxin family protein [Acidimicrobiales bacterium]
MVGPLPDAVVEPDVLEILERIGRSRLGEGFYLAGGTGLALQLGHRRSNDLDYFVDARRLDRPLVQGTIEAVLSGHGPFDMTLEEAGQLDYAVGERRRKVSFIAYPFPGPSPRNLVLAHQQRCAGVLEIAAMKAYSLGRRSAARDYVDIEAAISKAALTLGQIVAAARSRFVLDGEVVFSERMFLQQLVYTRDLDDKPDLLLVDRSFDEIEESLRLIVARYVREEIR